MGISIEFSNPTLIFPPKLTAFFRQSISSLAKAQTAQSAFKLLLFNLSKNNGKNLDIKFSKKPMLVLSNKFKQSLSKKINFYKNKNNKKLSKYLENANREGFIIRPDRFILASIKNLKDVKLITKRNLKLLV